MFEILLTPSAKETLVRLEKDGAKARLLKQVRKTIGFLQTNPRHPSLNTHAYQTIVSPFSKDEKVFEAYAQNRTPGAYRVFWCYGPNKKQISIIAITPHP